MDRECVIFAQTWCNRTSGSPSFLLANHFFLRIFFFKQPMKTSGGSTENAPNGTLLLFGHFPKSLQRSLGIFQRVANTTELLIKGSQRALGTFLDVSRNTFANVLFISLVAASLYLLGLKSNTPQIFIRGSYNHTFFP
jgi:hypothetical protein